MKKGMGNVFTGDGTAILRSCEPQEGLVICRAKGISSFLSYIIHTSRLFKGSNCRLPTLQSSALPVKVVLPWLCGLRILFSLSNVITTSILVTLIVCFVIIC